MFHIGLNKFGFFVFYLLFCLLIGSSISALAKADLSADMKFNLYIPTTLKTESQLSCFNKSRIPVSNWRYGFENEYRKHEIRYNNEINEYRRLRRDIDSQLVTFFALDSTGKAALWSGTIAQLFKTLADAVQNTLGILVGPQGAR